MPVDVEREIQAPALLVSEILSSPDRAKLVQCATLLKNPGPRGVELQLLGTGCACYGLVVDGRRLSPGDKVTIPAQSDASLEISAQPPDAQTVKDYTADLQVTHPGGGTQLLPLHCQLMVYQDVRIVPNVITFEVSPEKSGSQTRKLLIEAVTRGSLAEDSVPAFEGLPDFATIRSISRLEAEETLEDGLRRRSWQAEFVVDRPGEILPDTPPLPFRVTVQSPSGGDIRQTTGHLVLQVRRPIAFPARVYMGKVRAGEARQRRILLTSTDDQPFTLQLDAKPLPAFLQVNLDAGSQRQHWIELLVTPRKPGEFSGELLLKTDRPEQPVLAITVTGNAETPESQ
jgi:hypothetical protein